jgi:hypothetical protein
MGRDYWNINQILLTEATTEVRFLKQAPGLGHLDPLRASSGATDLPAGSSLSLPLWLISPMTQMGLVEPQLTEMYGESMQNVLRKGPEGARLGEKSKNYFRVGLTLSWLMPDRKELAAAILVGSLQRIRQIIDRSALSVRSEDREAEFVHLFTDNEARIYFSATEANELYDMWRHGALSEIRPRAELLPLLRPLVSEN